MKFSQCLFFFVASFFLSCGRNSGGVNRESVLQKYATKKTVIPLNECVIPLVGSFDSSNIRIMDISKEHSKFIPNEKQYLSKGFKQFHDRSKLKRSIPGVAPNLLPKLVKSKFKKNRAIQPIPVKTGPMKLKDNSRGNIQYLDLSQGLNGATVMSIHQDKFGFLWIGSSNGLSRYDGSVILNYTFNEGLPDTQIWNIINDKHGNLWLGTESGPVKYDGKDFIYLSDEIGALKEEVYAMHLLKNGDIWFLIEGVGACLFDGDSFVIYSMDQGLSSNSLTGIVEDADGNIWLVSDSGDLNRFDGNSFIQYPIHSDYNSSCYSIIQDKLGNIWLGLLGTGICKFNDKVSTYYNKQDGLISDDNIVVFEDKEGILWLGTYDSGICRLIDSELEHFSIHNGLSSSRVLSIFEDNVGNIWIGTSSGGLAKMQMNTFSQISNREGLRNERIMSVYADKKDDFWFGGAGNYLSRLHGEHFTHYTGFSSEDINKILAIEDDPERGLWMGSDAGVSYFDGLDWYDYNTAIGTGGSEINDIVIDDFGRKWFSTTANGLFELYQGKVVNYKRSQGLSSDRINCLELDNQNNLWIGTEGGGLNKWNGKVFEQFSFPRTKAGEFISVIKAWKDGQILLGTNGGGVIISSDNEYFVLNKANGLSNDVVRSIVVESENVFWVSTDRGLNKIENKSGRYEIQNYYHSDGLLSETFMYNSDFIDNLGNMWWGTDNGVIKVDPKMFNFKSNQPTVYLDEVEINEQHIDFHELFVLKDSLEAAGDERLKLIHEFSDVVPFFNFPSQLKLPFNSNHLTFHFSGLDWSEINKLKYQFILDGFDPYWSSFSSENRVDYRSLPAGQYIFKIRAVGSSGVVSNAMEFPFEILPPWYKTIWAYFGYILGIILLLFAFIKRREREFLLRQKELELKIDEATSEIKDQKQLIEQKHDEIQDSILYAERIQRALLASDHLLRKYLNEYFIFFKPKDVVSGDFYWATHINKKFILVTADSTGHGVPGAIMSTLNISCLKEAIQKGKESPDQILYETRRLVIENLRSDSDEEGGKDGMDCSLIEIDSESLMLRCANANNAIWILREKEWIEIKADRLPIGRHVKDSEPFTLHSLQLKKGDLIYTFTDGFADQFGGENEKKLKSKHLQKYLLSISDLPVNEQKSNLMDFFNNWKGELEQIDDVTIIGIKI